MDEARARRLVAERRQRAGRSVLPAGFTDEWFPEQRAFNDDRARLKAALCSRRAGKTRGGCRAMVRDAATTTGGRFLYVNSTRDECEKLAWYGAKGDGMASLVERCRLAAKLNYSKLNIHFPAIDSWIYLRGADDEQEIRKLLGLPYHRVWWDEAQKIPPKLTAPIVETLLPSLLDYGGTLELTGTPVRALNSLFFEVTRPEIEKRRKGWSVHQWTLLDNPFWGATREERHQRGVLGLQDLLGGPAVAPLDSPIMLREAGGRWIYEDANYVYPVHRVPPHELCYAPARLRPDGYPDVNACLADLPGWNDKGRDWFLVLGVDLGYSPDPFAWVLWAYSYQDPALYEVASYKRTGLVPDRQAALIQELRDAHTIGLVTADAGGGGKLVVAGWSEAWMDRYAIPVIEATKTNKHGAIELMGNDVLARRIKVREGGAWLTEAREHQWATVMSATGRMVEDPTTANHCLDAGLYAFRESYHHRYRTPDLTPEPGSAHSMQILEAELEDAACDDQDDSDYHAWR